MTAPTDLYRPSLALLTDLYQLTMAYGYWKLGLAEREAVFHLTFRKNPFLGGYAIAAGLEAASDYLSNLSISEADCAFLASLTGNDGGPLFAPDFLDYLGKLHWQLDVDGIPEGTAVFPHEPLLRVKGPLLQAQLVETPLLTMVNFATLIATKSSRVCAAADGDPVLEFGLRRAQGIDGGLTASRAAYVGGCAATSNVLAGRLFDIPVKGTHAHSWVMCFDREEEAFSSYAEALPNNCVFLVDTYDTVQGVRNAVAEGLRLRERGFEMMGIRLDSGDLADLAKKARVILDEGGFPNASIVASNDLDEHRITALKAEGAPISVWGVGTRLATARDQPALGGVYKLAAIRDEDGVWEDRIKLSETPVKISNPGMQQVLRAVHPDGTFAGDVISDVRDERPPGPEGTTWEPLLIPVLREGRLVADLPDVHTSRLRTAAQVSSLPEGVSAMTNPAPYPVQLAGPLFRRKEALIAAARARTREHGGTS
ncbi:MAG: nicotinate phosphoribosyltransferase [Deltaproteobacteria bacterium]|nr:nicotinate phosphoribosyltransferase [Deltaproteobacteria bacterium]